MTGVEECARRIAEVVRRELRERSRRPEATYRVQFHPRRFTFRDAAAIVPYLQQLGVSHVYASPYLKARPGSAHGYDVVDHHRLNPELGSPDDYRDFVAALHERGMGQVLDIVPNHMGVATSENRWWNDVLENGPGSPYAHFFDIDWRPVKPELRDKLLLPILGEQYGQVLESGDLQLQRQAGAFFLQYHDLQLPIEPKSYSVLLAHRFDELKARLGADSEPLIELQSILTALDYLPDYTTADPESVVERQREKEVIKGRLEALARDSAEIAGFLERNIREFNGDPDRPRSFDLLDGLLARQVYRLCHWKAASDEINYRRFFDINELAALCMEEPDVFEDAHRLVFELLADGAIDGLRIDHIDGLFDPDEYLWRLQWGYLRALGRRAFSRLVEAPQDPARPPAVRKTDVAAVAVGLKNHPAKEPGGTALAANETDEDDSPDWPAVERAFVELLHAEIGGPPVDRLFPQLVPRLPEGATRTVSGNATPGLPARSRRGLPLYVVVEKILEASEDLPADWPVAGTTGYEFLNSAAGLFVDAAGFRELKKRYQRFTGRKRNLRDVVYQSKRLIIHVAMAAELQLLAVRLNRLSEQHRRFRDFTLNNLRTALQEIIACFPVYRTYITAETAAGVSDRDREFIAVAVRRARRRNPTLDVRLFEFVRDVLLLEQPPELDPRSLRARRFFVGRFQQVTSPVMAKGVEDTAFYRYFPLSSLNEVGGGVLHAATSVPAFHAENASRQARRAGSLLCSTSHDTKRSEDVRARIGVLSEVPGQWRTALSEWSRYNRRHRREIDGQPAPSRNDEYLFYQTLVGVWPLDPPTGAQREQLIERLQDYMQKATHEAKLHTSWVNPDPDYDDAVRCFVRGALQEDPKNRFLPGFLAFHERVVDWGLYAALSQLLLKLMAPGVPDLYQGQELWDFSLVDPDNRRPVDYERRKRILSDLQQQLHEDRNALLATARHLARHPRDERLKLFVTWRALQFRRQQPSLFRDGRYVPLNVTGSQSDHLCAYAWVEDGQRDRPASLALVAVPRLMAKLVPGGFPHPFADSSPQVIWSDTAVSLDGLPALPLANLFTGRDVPAAGDRVAVADILADFPVAVLCDPASATGATGASGAEREPATVI